MRGKFVVAAVAAALIVSVADAAPRPIDYVRTGCLVRTYMNPASTYGQTFKPTFSVLRQVRFALFEEAPADGDVTFVVNLRDNSGILATSLGGVLTPDTSFEDAERGEFVTLVFDGGAPVTPGQTYTLELVPVSGDAPVWACLVDDWPDGGFLDGYADGYFFWDDNVQAGKDMAFAAKGSGPPK
jgi:hypothetical protein